MKKAKKFKVISAISVFVIIFIMIPLVAVTTSALDICITPNSGSCGENLTWNLDDSGILTISGTGEMDDNPRFMGYPMFIVIESGVTSIGEDAFDNWSQLTDVSIPDTVTSIGASAFKGCSSLTNVTIPDSVRTIEHSAFADCSSLVSVNIPNGVTALNPYTFWNCSALASINIPDSVINIKNSAFARCSNLTDVTIPDSVTTIEYYAFGACDSLADIIIPNSVKNIGNLAFADCYNLKSISIPNKVTSIGISTFANCSNLESVILSDSITSIGGSAFSGCTNIENVYYCGTKEKWETISIESDNESLINSKITFDYNIKSAQITEDEQNKPKVIQGSNCGASLTGSIGIVLITTLSTSFVIRKKKDQC